MKFFFFILFSLLFGGFVYLIGDYVFEEKLCHGVCNTPLQYSEQNIVIQTPIPTPKIYSIDSFLEDNQEVFDEGEEIFSHMTDEQKVGMVLMPAWEESITLEKIEYWKKNFFIGGVFLLRKNFSVEDIKTIKFDENFEIKDLPLLIAIDAEPSLLYKNFSDLDTQIQNTNQLTTQKKSQQAAQKIAREMKKFFIDINFAPVYDTGKNAAIIGNRSFGKQNVDVQILATSFAEELKKEKILATAKHFPGHGNVIGDSHKILPKISGVLAELENFAYAIQKKIPIIMVGHLAIEKNSQWNTNGLPATVSKKIVTALLRKKLQFKGLIITDAMNMGAVSTIKNAEIKALEAGADIILMPKNLETTHSAIVQKMKLDTVFRAQVEEKVKRILKMKIILQKISSTSQPQ